jgi:hypothetical protein
MPGTGFSNAIGMPYLRAGVLSQDDTKRRPFQDRHALPPAGLKTKATGSPVPLSPYATAASGITARKKGLEVIDSADREDGILEVPVDIV